MQLVLLVLLVPHLVTTGLGAFYDGLLHFFVTPSDLLLALAAGLLAGQRGKAAARGVIVALPAAWLAGALIAIASITDASVANAALAIATTLTSAGIGVLLAADVPLRARSVTLLVTAAAALHGFAGDVESTTSEPPSGLWLAGTLLGAFAVVTLASAFVVDPKAPWRRIALRVAGVVLVAIGGVRCVWS